MKKLNILFILLFFNLLVVNLFAQVPVLTQPQNQTVTEGETASFSVTVIGGLLPVTYQWQVTLDQNPANFANIPGATSSGYTTPPTTLSMDDSWYRCVVTNDSGSTNSNYATLTVNPIISPSITSQPSNQNIFIGQTATFSLTATGTQPLSYQWYADLVAIPGATSSSYTTDVINDIGADGTVFYCIVSNAGGSEQSNSVTLNVSYENARVTDGLQVLYNFKEGSGGTVNDESGVGSPLNLAISNPAEVNWTPKGLNVNSEIRVKSTQVASKIINSCVISNELTFEAWFIPTDMVQRNIYARIMTMTNTSRSTSNIKLDQFGTDYNFKVRTTSTGLNGQNFATTGNVQELTHFVATKDVSGNVKIYINGTEVASELLSGNFSNWDGGYFLFLGSDAENGVYWQGTFYLTAIYSRSLSESEVNQNYYYGVDYDSLPLIAQQPVDVNFKPIGQTATYSIVAIGNAPLTYQWYRNNNPISGATSSSYTTPPVNLGNNNDTYKCVVTSSDGSAESNSALLTVSEPDERITLNMIAQYTFTEGGGSMINDVSGVGVPVNLVINTPETVEWIDDGISINGEANISSVNAATKFYDLCTATNQMTIETWIKPANTTQNNPSRIVNYALDGSARNLSLTQEGGQYSGRVRTTTTTNNASPDVLSLAGSVEDKPQHVVFVFREDGVSIVFINGVESNRRTLNGDFSNWDNSYRFGIANEFIDSRSWLGAMNYLAIFNRRLSSEEVLHNFNVGPYEAEFALNAPTELVATSLELGRVNLTWADNSLNEDNFVVERNESNPSVWNEIATLPANSNMFSDTNVVEGKSYDYRVKSVNSFIGVDSAYSNIASAATLLKSPTALVGRADELGKITLDWTDNSSAETGFNIERGDAEADSIIYTVIGSSNANVTTYDDFSIEEGIIYSYRVRAFNDVVTSGVSNVLNIRSKASFVSAPTNLNIELHPSYAVPVLTWIDNAFNENGFVIERRKVSIGENFIAIDTLGANITTVTDGTVLDSTSYIYRVYAFNDEYNSDYSAEVFIDVLTGVEEIEIPKEFGLLQNYPNPFNPTTTFTFNLPEASDVSLTIYNLLGQKIFKVVENNYSPGTHSVVFDASKLTSGIYVYTLNATSSSGEKFVQTKKLILLK